MRNVARHYMDALEELDVRPAQLGPMEGFYPGSDDVRAREESLLEWMQPRRDGPLAGRPVLQVFRGAVPELDKEIRNAHYKFDKPDKREQDIVSDTLDCLEYGAAFRPRYFEPQPKTASEVEPVWEAWKDKKRKAKQSKRRNLRNRQLGALR